jgi:hypothetical protein
VTEEKRRFTRIPFDADVLLSKEGKEWRTTLQDISLNGLLVNTPANWDGVEGEHFRLEIIFANSSNLISGEVKVAHMQDDKVGFRVVNIDVDSVAHLRRLVELNIGDEELLNRELSALHWK